MPFLPLVMGEGGGGGGGGSIQYIYFIEVAKHTIKQTSKITAITTPGSLEQTFDPVHKVRE